MDIGRELLPIRFEKHTRVGTPSRATRSVRDHGGPSRRQRFCVPTRPFNVGKAGDRLMRGLPRLQRCVQALLTGGILLPGRSSHITQPGGWTAGTPPCAVSIRNATRTGGHSIDFDFHTISHHGGEALINKHYVSIRSRGQRRSLALVARDADARVFSTPSPRFASRTRPARSCASSRPVAHKTVYCAESSFATAGSRPAPTSPG